MPEIKIENDEHWHSLRKTRGGSSDVGALYGIGYANAPGRWSLWASKLGKLPPIVEDERMEIGRLIQPVIVELAAKRLGVDYVDSGGVYRTHPDETLPMGATCDYVVVEHEDGPGIIECKNRDFLQWRDSYDETDASDRDRLQLAHQMACWPAATWGVIAVLVGGSELYCYRYTREAMAETIMEVENAWREFWDNFEKEPQLTNARELPVWLATRANDAPVDETIDLGGEFEQTIKDFQSHDERAKFHDNAAKTARAQIIQALDRHKVGVAGSAGCRAKYSAIKESTSVRKAHERVSLSFFERAPVDPDSQAADESTPLDAG